MATPTPADADNPALRMAFRLCERTGTNIFLTGKAGTGKTTFLRNLCKKSAKRIIVAAPTGIAAVNAQGVTLHSLLQLPFGPYVPGSTVQLQKFRKQKLALIRSMDMLVIDEVSMVRADLLDLIDAVLRRLRNPALPFGGVQLLLIGDLQQLPPVVKEAEWSMLREIYPSPYFFHSKALAQAGYISIELEKVYRQSDAYFLSLLNNIRRRRDLDATLAQLNRRYIPSFKPAKGVTPIQLVTHNNMARSVNEQRLDVLEGEAVTYTCEVQGTFPENSYPADEKLTLKPGAQVMFLKNDSASQQYFNGMIGEVQELKEDAVSVKIPGREEPITVGFENWENTTYQINAETKEMETRVEGIFSQIPLRTAWAITIHKSQGLTFDHALIDASAAFAHGQTYVALSRCRNLEGLVLTSPLTAASVITDPAVDSFLEQGRLTRPDGSRVELMELEYVASLLDSLFMPQQLVRLFDDYFRLCDEAFKAYMPELLKRFSHMTTQLEELTKVGRTFARQYRQMLFNADVPLSESPVQSRIKSGAAYFIEPLRSALILLEDTPKEHDNARTKQRLEIARDPLERELMLAVQLLQYLCEKQFSTADFLKQRAHVISEIETPAKRVAAKAKVKKQAKNTAKAKVTAVSDIGNQELFDALRRWRTEKAKAIGKPAFTVFSTKALMSIASLEPRTMSELKKCSGVGPVLADRYGAEIIEIVEKF